ncbi:hypothetical protein V6N12_035676 [Hibiscus sabdariffa]|uniref:Uncharacterized protein n=1 Tax=Hibiscus sabdariffa TaxID=183260 RepID=A0ABR2ENE9_9ROSI
MHSQENSTGKPLTPRKFDDFGGRPPDGIPTIPPLSSLERPSSPTLLEGQSVVKKGQNTTTLDGDNGTNASKVISSKTISCDKENASQVEGICSETNLYGEWMIVQPRRRGNDLDDVIDVEGRGSTRSGRNMGDSHYHNGQERGVIVGNNSYGMEIVGGNATCSTAYLALNLDKKKKANKKQLGPVEVVSTMDGAALTVVTHVPIPSGELGAASIAMDTSYNIHHSSEDEEAWEE